MSPQTVPNIGDLASHEMGSAARSNSGKPDWSLMPLSQISAILWPKDPLNNLGMLLGSLGAFQEKGDAQSAYKFLQHAVYYTAQDTGCTEREILEDVILIWEFGKKKYAAFNWMKGMAWSNVIASATRHIIALFEGQMLDDESEMHHGLHVICNAMMLCHYVQNYKEGNDLPCNYFS